MILLLKNRKLKLLLKLFLEIVKNDQKLREKKYLEYINKFRRITLIIFTIFTMRM